MDAGGQRQTLPFGFIGAVVAASGLPLRTASLTAEMSASAASGSQVDGMISKAAWGHVRFGGEYRHSV